ncbi:hypothetical protein K505DRAFT_9158 [Melanomma pulvis-pyrius CBS 109.77]|uniref:Uncharacterized protein n=1 Tax=Melanomma pulvis-pyrius CBS 109.77 TaxID=1314802 RepID=A0A6A6XGM9_9PLEO|nr:hypothetical protein K505DRAFT_9158 [Melanomma pulvis-pyrius CBS 109.77]
MSPSGMASRFRLRSLTWSFRSSLFDFTAHTGLVPCAATTSDITSLVTDNLDFSLHVRNTGDVVTNIGLFSTLSLLVPMSGIRSRLSVTDSTLVPYVAMSTLL